MPSASNAEVSPDSGTTVVETSVGKLHGKRRPDGSAAFRGIRYAEAPVGEHRFAAPRPVAPWDDVRDALAYGPAAMQAPRAEGAGASGIFGVAGPQDMSEDCLHLNVYTPALDGRRRPVMVWIHGGAFRSGSTSIYPGGRLAAAGDVVVVTVGYRLGILGFLHDPDLGVANAGLFDQVEALRWVQREIAAFGGDPDQVTVFGESAGGKSVECLLAMPDAAGLFSRAIAQSTYALPMDAATAAERTAAVAAAAGCDGPEDLRHLDPDELIRADGSVPDMVGPVVDGATLPRLPVDAVRSGDIGDVAVMVGTTLDESTLFGAGAGEADEGKLHRTLRRTLGLDDDAIPAAIDAYRTGRAELGAPTGPASLIAAVQTDAMFRQHSIGLADVLADAGHHTFAYLFTWPSPALGGRLGACHAIDVPFVFDTIDARGAAFTGSGPDADGLVELVQSAWTSFARGGRPGGSWPDYGPARSTMILGEEPHAADDPLGAVRELWSRHSA